MANKELQAAYERYTFQLEVVFELEVGLAYTELTGAGEVEAIAAERAGLEAAREKLNEEKAAWENLLRGGEGR